MREMIYRSEQTARRSNSLEWELVLRDFYRYRSHAGVTSQVLVSWDKCFSAFRPGRSASGQLLLDT